MSQPLDQLLVNLAAVEQADDLEAAKLLVEQVRRRVDEIKEYTDRLYAEGERLGKYRQDFQKSAAACKNEADRIYARVKWCMEQASFSDLPGRKWRAHLQDQAQDLKITRPADIEMFKAFPELVKRETSYAWNEDAIRIWLDSGKEFSYGHLVDNRYVKFYVKKEV